jgi:hypothetical protein
MENFYGQLLTPFTLILVTLAAGRITRFIALDRVPFGSLREKIKDKAYDQDTKILPQHPWNWIAALVVCPWCVGVYVGIGALLALIFIPQLVVQWLSLPFAIMMMASFFGGWMHTPPEPEDD